ncbi:hypothetical protein AALF16_16755 [Bacillus cereus]|uniref:response regulator aspartate phosphatase n=1 Tax=Bacillus cereus TaxID=1396 RepID=UPI00356BDF7D
MKININENEKISSLLNLWYEEIIKYKINEAQQIKNEVDTKIKETYLNPQVQIYYALLDFRFQVLIDGLSINKQSFERIESLELPTDHSIQYYYYFFKAIHETILTNYNEAETYFNKAEELLVDSKDEIEKAEFNYRLATFYYQTYQPLLAIQQASKAKETFKKHGDYKVIVALCDNVNGLSCIDLKQFVQAEESFDAAINILQKESKEDLLLRVRSNIGWLYENQNLATLAIRHLSEVNQKIPNHVRAIFSEAEANYKLGEYQIAEDFIKRGLKVSKELENQEYLHRFLILQEMNKTLSAERIENVVLEAVEYFKNHKLWEAIHEYTEKLAIKFYDEDNHHKASKYFYQSIEAHKQSMEKGALK